MVLNVFCVKFNLKAVYEQCYGQSYEKSTTANCIKIQIHQTLPPKKKPKTRNTRNDPHYKIEIQRKFRLCNNFFFVVSFRQERITFG